MAPPCPSALSEAAHRSRTDTRERKSPKLETASSAHWVQLVLGQIVMMAITSPQFVWTLFLNFSHDATAIMLSEARIMQTAAQGKS